MSVTTELLEQLDRAVDFINLYVDGKTTTKSHEVEVALRKYVQKLQRTYNSGQAFPVRRRDALPAGRPKKTVMGSEPVGKLITE